MWGSLICFNIHDRFKHIFFRSCSPFIQFIDQGILSILISRCSVHQKYHVRSENSLKSAFLFALIAMTIVTDTCNISNRKRLHGPRCNGLSLCFTCKKSCTELEEIDYIITQEVHHKGQKQHFIMNKSSIFYLKQFCLYK